MHTYSIRLIACTVASITLFAASLKAAQNATIAPAKHPDIVLVELFTSEGCSSCPPADALLSQINGSQTADGQLIVGISEHVTYWNSLGWSDSFSSDTYTDRQNGYGRKFNLDSVFTPQMVVNGSEQLNGSNKAELTRAIQRQKQQPPGSISLRILSTHASGSKLTVTYAANGEIPPHGADIIAVLADDADKSNVLRGENSGRTLMHVAIARSLTHIATLREAGERSTQISLPPSFRTAQSHHIILFAQASNYGRVLGTDIKPL